ncbi:MAG: hypothetical protein ACLFR1_09265 [Spirochaetia bacterium]
MLQPFGRASCIFSIPNIEDNNAQADTPVFSGCPGSMAGNLPPNAANSEPQGSTVQKQESALSQWPIQLHLILPQSAMFNGCDLLLAADCTAFASPELHTRFLAGKKLAIACPKLDSGTDMYLQKLVHLIDESKIKSITVLRMEVPCCGGLSAIAQKAVSIASGDIPVEEITLSINGGTIV